MSKIHPTALVDAGAQVADDVEIGPYAVIEPDVSIGEGCRIAGHALIRRYTSLGRGNRVDPFCVLGGPPQDLKFDPETVTHLRIGDNNVFREGATLNRGSKPGGASVVGSRTYFMTAAHLGHDAIVGDDAILANGAAAGGHATIGPRTFLSAHVVIHQFCWIGEGVMTQGNSGFSTHVPPFVTGANINYLVGLNVVGLRRNPEVSKEDIAQIKEAFRLTYRSRMPKADVIAAMDAHEEWGGPASRFRDFVRKVFEAEPPFRRGLCPVRLKSRRDETDARAL